MKTNILEFIKDLLSMFIEESNYQERGFHLIPNGNEIINNFVTKSTRILTSLIEGNTDNEIIENLLERLDFWFIKHKLIDEYTSFVEKQLNLSRNSSIETINEKLFSGKIQVFIK